MGCDASTSALPSLQRRYGNVGAAVINQAQGSVMRAGLVELTLRCESSAAVHTKRLPGMPSTADVQCQLSSSSMAWLAQCHNLSSESTNVENVMLSA